MKIDKKTQLKLLKNRMQPVYQLKCDMCDVIYESESQEVIKAFDIGWTIYNNNCLCPACTKEQLGIDIILNRIQFK